MDIVPRCDRRAETSHRSRDLVDELGHPDVALGQPPAVVCGQRDLHLSADIKQTKSKRVIILRWEPGDLLFIFVLS